jgi:peptidoglycan/LPS O-acetylase OafA/YrhL
MTVAAPRAASVRDGSYIGGLDGLRALAVAAVIVYHFAPSVLPAGFLGVDVFFVVSGFLIARLLVTDTARSGRVSLTNFWGRRARRLLPALATMTVIVCVAAAIDFSAAELHNVRSHALGTLFYCANWVMIVGKGSYFATTGRPSPFLHMWSLAVEEQFYVVLPLAFLCVRRALVRRPIAVATVALLGAVASTLWMWALVSPGEDPSRAYLGSDSHAMGLLVGVALGVVAGAGRPWETFAARVRARPATLVPCSFGLAVVALAGIGLTMRFADDRTQRLYHGGFLVFSLACGVLIASVVLTPTTPVARLLQTRWLVAVGLRSYSLYLWHWPVRVFVTERPGLDGFGLFAVRLMVSVALAEVSFRFVERPLRTGLPARRFGSRAAVAYFAALAVASGALVATVAAPKPVPPPSLSLALLYQDPNAQHVDIFGDSTALVWGLNGANHRRELGILVGGDARIGCAIVEAPQYNGDVLIPEPAECRDRDQTWRDWVRKDPKAVLALMTGAWDVLDHQAGTGRVNFGTRAWTDLVTNSFRTTLRMFTDAGHTVHLFEVPCYGAGEALDRIPERADPRRVAALNAIFEQLVREMPRVKIVRWRNLVCPGGHRIDEIDGVRMWEPDHTHLTEKGALVVWKWFLPQVRGSR